MVLRWSSSMFIYAETVPLYVYMSMVVWRSSAALTTIPSLLLCPRLSNRRFDKCRLPNLPGKQQQSPKQGQHGQNKSQIAGLFLDGLPQNHLHNSWSAWEVRSSRCYISIPSLPSLAIWWSSACLKAISCMGMGQSLSPTKIEDFDVFCINHLFHFWPIATFYDITKQSGQRPAPAARNDHLPQGIS